MAAGVNQALRRPDCFYEHLRKNVLLSEGTVIGCHLCKKSGRENFLTPKHSTVNCWWQYNKVGATGDDSNSAMCCGGGRPRKLMERGQRMLRWPTFCRVNHDRPPSFTWPIGRVDIGLHGTGFHDRAAASKPYIMKRNA